MGKPAPAAPAPVRDVRDASFLYLHGRRDFTWDRKVLEGLRFKLAEGGGTLLADAALLLEVIGGHDPCDSTSIDEPAPPLVSELERGVEGLRIGIVEELSDADGIQPYVKAAVEAAANALTDAGAKVERSYQHIDPTAVGNQGRLVVSELGGKANTRIRA